METADIDSSVAVETRRIWAINTLSSLATHVAMATDMNWQLDILQFLLLVGFGPVVKDSVNTVAKETVAKDTVAKDTVALDNAASAMDAGQMVQMSCRQAFYRVLLRLATYNPSMSLYRVLLRLATYNPCLSTVYY